MQRSLFKFTLVVNSVLVFRELLVYEFLLGVSQTLLCSVSVHQVKFVLLLDALQLIMLFVGMLTYLERKRHLLIIFYTGTFLIIKMLHSRWIYIYSYIDMYRFFAHPMKFCMTALKELLLFCKWYKLSWAFCCLYVLHFFLLIFILWLTFDLFRNYVNKLSFFNLRSGQMRSLPSPLRPSWSPMSVINTDVYCEMKYPLFTIIFLIIADSFIRLLRLFNSSLKPES
jgi:hypothetical protein